MRRVYMDNAATSFPKPPAVMEAMVRFAGDLGASARGTYAAAKEAGGLVLECRRRVARLINADLTKPEHIVFGLNATDALNTAIHGILHPNTKRRHAITTWMEHNSVLRPMHALETRLGFEITRVRVDSSTGLVDPNDIRRAIRPDTGLIVVNHGSNVGGTLQPIGAIGRIAREHEVPYLVDAAQTLGHVPIDVQAMNIDLLAAPGHKGLLGPQGTGVLYIRPGIESLMQTIREGGTGSRSDLDHQPEFLPDRFEAGSHNALGIAGLSEGVQWILDKGIDNVWRHEQALCRMMIEGLSDALSTTGLTFLGPQGIKDRCGVFSVRMTQDGLSDPLTVSRLLEERYGIITRAGIHCAPLAHQTYGTHNHGGTARFSLGPFLTTQDVLYACDALAQLCQEHAAVAK